MLDCAAITSPNILVDFPKGPTTRLSAATPASGQRSDHSHWATGSW
jgi:hypothetical protein